MGSNSKSLIERIADWWMHDLPPLNGPLRFIIYTGLFSMAWFPLTRSPALLLTPELMGHMDPRLFTPKGLIAFIPFIPSYQFFSLVRAFTVVAWICAALGLFGRLATVTVGLGALLLQGYSFSCAGQLHVWYLGAYCLVCLMFATTDDEWTLDTLIGRRYPGYFFKPAPNTGQLSRTGFARKLVVLFSVAILFSGGVAKLYNSGFAWLDGYTLQSYISSAGKNLHPTLWPWLANSIIDNRWMAISLSIFTIILELGSPLALFSKRIRYVVFALACGFHLGIYLVMLPSFLVQMFVYLLVVDWTDVFGKRKTVEAPPALVLGPSRPVRYAAVTFASALVGLVIFVNAGRVEYWPVSHIPMYTTYWGQGRIGQFPASHFSEPQGLSEVSRLCQREYCSWWYWGEVFFRTKLRVRQGKQVTQVPIPSLAAPWVSRAQWKSVIAPALMEDFASQTPAPGEVVHGQLSGVLRTMADHLRPKYCAQHDCRDAQLELTYAFQSGPTVIAKMPLAKASVGK